MKRDLKAKTPFILIAAMAAAAGLTVAGPLMPPPGSIASTYKTLTEVEPRVLINATNTPGSANGVYVISQPGSYYLGANLIATGGKNGIVVAADNVTIDLNGYTIDGAGNTAFPTGITSLNTNRRGLVVRNGNINNFSGYGIFAQVKDSHFENLGFVGNKSGSLELFQADNCIARNIRISMTSGEAGLQLSENARVENCIVDGGNTGIMVGSNSVVTGCVLTNQPSTGINISGGRVEGCSIYTTKNANSFNNGGINAGTGTAVRDCTIRGVVSAGVYISGDGSIERCSFSQCVRGIASGQFSSGRVRIEGNDISECTVVGIDLPSGKHLVIGNRLRGNAVHINANAAVILGEVVNCTGSPLPVAASNPTANLTW